MDNPLNRGVDSCKIINEICTAHHCIKSDGSAQCTDPVHFVQVFTPEIISTPTTGAERYKRPLTPVTFVRNVPLSDISTPRQEVIQDLDTESHDQIPEQRTEQNFYSKEYWVKYDERIHTREGHKHSKSNQGTLSQGSLWKG